MSNLSDDDKRTIESVIDAMVQLACPRFLIHSL